MNVERAQRLLNQYFDGEIGIDRFNAKAKKYGLFNERIFQEIRAREELKQDPEQIQTLLGRVTPLKKSWALNAAVFKKVKEYNRTESPSARSPLPTRAPSRVKGIGLSNMGNTCFMNGALQGLLSWQCIEYILDKPLTQRPPESDESVQLKQDMEYRESQELWLLRSQRVEAFPKAKLYAKAVVGDMVRLDGETRAEFERRKEGEYTYSFKLWEDSLACIERFPSAEEYGEARASRIRGFSGEADRAFQKRVELKEQITILYQEQLSEAPNQRKIDKALDKIAKSSVFKGLEIKTSQEAADEFLRLLLDALEINASSEELTLQMQSDDLPNTHLVPPSPILWLRTPSDKVRDVSVQSLFKSIYRLEHRDTDLFRGILAQLPRSGANHRQVKEFRKIKGLLDSVACDVYDQTKRKVRRVQLVPDSIVCHLGGKYGNSGHYITIQRKEDDEGNVYYLEKNDSHIKRISSKLAKEIVEASGYIVHYSVLSP